jgi:hypothetical protein
MSTGLKRAQASLPAWFFTAASWFPHRALLILLPGFHSVLSCLSVQPL